MTYIEAIQKGFPGVHCHSVGIEDTYESLVWDSGNPLPSQQTLDEWIAANPNATLQNRRITILAFRNRFTVQEKVATELVSVDNSNATAPERQFAATVRVILRDTDSASFIDLDRADTRAGVMLLEQYGVIGVGRGDIILDTPVDDVERPLLTEF